MKKIRYLIIVIPILIIMLFSQVNVYSFDYYEWKPEDRDAFNVICIDNTTQIAYLGLISQYEGDAIVYMAIENDYRDISRYCKVGDYLCYSDGFGSFVPTSSPLQKDDIVWIVHVGELSNGVTTIKVFSENTNNYYIFNGDNLPIGMSTYVVDENGLPVVYNFNLEWFEYALNKGKQEMQEYYQSLIPDLLNEEFLKGKAAGIQEAYANINEDLPSWVLNYNLKLIDELYNYINYDSLTFYENVGQVTFDGSENWISHPTSTTENYYSMRIIIDNYIYNENLKTNYDIDVIAKSEYTTYRDINQLAIYHDGIYIYIKLSATNKTEFEQYLSQNPLIVTYELAEKQAYVIPEVEIAQLPFYNFGVSDGYLNGYQDATKNNNAIKGFIPSIIGSIWVVVANFLSFEVFGISLWWLFGILVAISFAIFIIRAVKQ